LANPVADFDAIRISPGIAGKNPELVAPEEVTKPENHQLPHF